MHRNVYETIKRTKDSGILTAPRDMSSNELHQIYEHVIATSGSPQEAIYNTIRDAFIFGYAAGYRGGQAAEKKKR